MRNGGHVIPQVFLELCKKIGDIIHTVPSPYNDGDER